MGIYQSKMITIYICKSFKHKLCYHHSNLFCKNAFSKPFSLRHIAKDMMVMPIVDPKTPQISNVISITNVMNYNILHCLC